jgi:hypothetical protein
MITLSNISPTATLIKKTATSNDSTQHGYVTVDMTSEKQNSIFLSDKAVKSLGINEEALNKDNSAYVLINPEMNPLSETFVTDWMIFQVAITGTSEEKKTSLKTTFKCDKYPPYKMARFNKSKRSINSKTMRTILVKEMKESVMLLIPTEHTSKFKLVPVSVHEAEIKAKADAAESESNIKIIPDITIDNVSDVMNEEIEKLDIEVKSRINDDITPDNVYDNNIVTANSPLNKVDVFLEGKDLV